jgi:WD40 repeat protein
MNDDREQFRRLRERALPVHPGVIEELRTHARPDGQRVFLPTLGLAALTTLVVVIAALTLRAAQPPADQRQRAAAPLATPAPPAAAATSTPAPGPLADGLITYLLPDGMYGVSPAGGESKLLLATSDSESRPAWSPDGRRLAFSRQPSGGGDGCCAAIYTVGHSGSGLTRVTHHPFPALDPQWSPDGRRIVYTGMTRSNPSNAYQDDRHLVPDLYVTDADGRRAVRIAERGANPAWSPDGSRIAFVRPRESDTGGGEQLWAANPDGGGLKRLSPERGVALDPAWSPDGDRIALTANHSVSVLPAEGGEPTPLAGRAHWTPDHSPAWSPDGERVAFIREYEGRAELMVVDARGGAPVRVADMPPNTASSVSWLPERAAAVATGDLPVGASLPEAGSTPPAPPLLRVGDITYRLGTEGAAGLRRGAPFAVVKVTTGPLTGENAHLEEGAATHLPPGATLYAEEGYRPEATLLALSAGRWQRYHALPTPRLKTGADLLDVAGRVQSVTIWRRRNAPTEVRDPRQVARIVEGVLRAPVRWRPPEGGAGAPVERFATLNLQGGGVVHVPDLLELPRTFWQEFER